MTRWSLATRMTVAVSTAVALILGLLILLQVRQAASTARAQAFVNAEQIALRYASQLGRDLNDAMLAARTVAQTFEGMKGAWVDDRSLYNSILKQVLLANTNFAATWSCWEAGALDGKDKDFSGKSGHDPTGRFIPVWYRAGQEAQLEKLAQIIVAQVVPVNEEIRRHAQRHENKHQRASQLAGVDPYLSLVGQKGLPKFGLPEELFVRRHLTFVPPGTR